MTPTGWHDDARFADAVMRFSPAAEPWAVSLKRLEAAVREDAKTLCVKPELTPRRVIYAYRHHPSLWVGSGERNGMRTRRTADVIVSDFMSHCEALNYFKVMFKRIAERKDEECLTKKE